ncbi:hypothetical protein [Companilactobacillus farciminis]|uniref:hypothetical protein n=1 Tax=Companilactobacillus farciminis TaxID=1612 RepID=UPI00191667C6|nr:hypothetical protein [Companilactobacillus farciminis]
MVNVIDNEARNRSNMMPVGVKIIDDKGNTTHTARTDLKTNYISLESKWFGSSSNNTGGGNTGGNTGGTTGGGTSQSQVTQLPSTLNLFSGSAVGNILLSGPSTNYDNVQDGLLITLSNLTPGITIYNSQTRVDLTPSGLKTINIPKEKLVVNSSFDISDQLSQYIGKTVQGQFYDSSSQTWSNYGSAYNFNIVSFGGTTINVLPNTTLSMNLTVNVKDSLTAGNGNHYNGLQIPVIQVNDYKN